MRYLRSKLVQLLLLLALPLGAHAETIVLQAISDFTNLESGEVPYYIETVGGRNAMAINAANPAYRDKFARADHQFLGADGIYDITIHALGEIDGDGTYRLVIDGVVQGEVVNAPVNTDYTVIQHVFAGIALTTQSIISVESKAVSNGLIPEGDGFAFARGRWRAVSLDLPDTSGSNDDLAADIGIVLSTAEILTNRGDQLPFVASINNYSDTTTATGVNVEFDLPEGVAFVSSESCVAAMQVVVCELPELAPGELSSISIDAQILEAGWQSVSASVSSDQADPNSENNAASIAFESLEALSSTGAAPIGATSTGAVSTETAAVVVVVPTATNNTAIQSPQTAGTTPEEPIQSVSLGNANQNDTVSGSLSLQTLLAILLFGFVRVRRLASS